ncbi:pyridoxal phosphate-dependent aminotransferase [uncultured Bifidobacterium sp.]|uniref:pyridoxal phosphate-dependent aminotransferase n=1 Tax=uncultured Bifidobacterium sp. TaxID=165187 RepID=UPI0028DB7530|nr:pyridoxal phosphate-dependent aminotransferase [uncultured Bifidobacterium sp.]
MPRLSSLVPDGGSVIREMFTYALERDDLISFAVGEPGRTPSRPVIEAMVSALREGRTHYTSNAGIPELCRGLCDLARSSRALEYDPAREVIVTTGAIEALFLAFRTIVSPGDGVLLPDPGFPNYLNQITVLGGEVQTYVLREDRGFRATAEDIEAAVRPNTRVLLLNSPSNPTGAVIPPAELARIADVARRHDLWVVSDEVYRRFLYGDVGFLSIAAVNEDMRDRTIVVDSFSKTNAMTGIRLGYAYGPEQVIAAMRTIQEDVVSCVATPAQYGGVAALADSDGLIDSMRAQYARNRDLIFAAIARMPGVECDSIEGAFYAFPSIRGTGLDSRDFAMRLLKEAGVVVVPGYGFGPHGEGHVRLSFVGREEEVAEGLERMVCFTRKVAEESRVVEALASAD